MANNKPIPTYFIRHGFSCANAEKADITRPFWTRLQDPPLINTAYDDAVFVGKWLNTSTNKKEHEKVCNKINARKLTEQIYDSKKKNLIICSNLFRTLDTAIAMFREGCNSPNYEIYKFPYLNEEMFYLHLGKKGNWKIPGIKRIQRNFQLDNIPYIPEVQSKMAQKIYNKIPDLLNNIFVVNDDGNITNFIEDENYKIDKEFKEKYKADFDEEEFLKVLKKFLEKKKKNKNKNIFIVVHAHVLRKLFQIKKKDSKNDRGTKLKSGVPYNNSIIKTNINKKNTILEIEKGEVLNSSVKNYNYRTVKYSEKATGLIFKGFPKSKYKKKKEYQRCCDYDPFYLQRSKNTYKWNCSRNPSQQKKNKSSKTKKTREYDKYWRKNMTKKKRVLSSLI